MHTIGTLYAQSVVDDRISRAAAQRAAREATRPSAKPRRQPRLHVWRPRRAAAPSV